MLLFADALISNFAMGVLSFVVCLCTLYVVSAANMRIPPSNCSDLQSVFACSQNDYTASYEYTDAWRPDDMYTGKSSESKSCSCYCMSSSVYVKPTVAGQVPCEKPSYLYGALTGWLSVENTILTFSILSFVVGILQMLFMIVRLKPVQRAFISGANSVRTYLPSAKAKPVATFGPY